MDRILSRGSLRRRVLVLGLSSVALVWVCAAVYSYVDARHETTEILDGYLAQSAALLAAQAPHELDDAEMEHAPQLHRYARQVAFQIWDHGRVLRLHSPNAPDQRLMAREEGFADVEIAGRPWRAFSSWDHKRALLIQVAEERGARDAIAASVGRGLLTPLLLALPVLAGLLWWAVAAGLRPLRALGEQVAHRAPDNLAPLDSGSAPTEVAPLVSSLNHLFDRVSESIARERQFTADAAHELRTPIAALRTQAQVASGATSDAERDRAMRQVIAGCDRAARLVDQMLTLARLDPVGAARPSARCDLAAIVRSVLADAAPEALRKSVEVELVADGVVDVAGDATLLAILARNLVDNAVRYGSAGTGVRVAVARHGGRVELRVADNGPGVPDEELSNLGRRFYRRAATQETGSGLGLSIVQRIAEVHDGTVTFRAPEVGTGLVATVILPAFRSAAARPGASPITR